MSYKIDNHQTFRVNVSKNLAATFPLLSEKPNFFINLEKGIYNYAIKEATSRKIIKKWENPFFVQLYTDRLRSIFINLNNKDFQEIILSEGIESHTIAFMTHQEMNPKRWSTLIQQKALRDQSKLTTNIEASTDMYTCKKCKSKRCTYYELQIRSADEPATIFVTCLDCGKHWKG
jgi:DNA-directed RNA polymerase subunit M/transcription elongation factor TFIIS